MRDRNTRPQTLAVESASVTCVPIVSSPPPPCTWEKVFRMPEPRCMVSAAWAVKLHLRIDVQVFVYTYMGKSLYSLGLTVVAEPPFNTPLCGDEGKKSVACSLQPYAEGAAMLAASLAILNIVLFERSLNRILRTIVVAAWGQCQ